MLKLEINGNKAMFSELDFKKLWKELDEDNTELDKEGKLLQDVWLKISQMQTKNEQEMAAYMSKEEFTFLPPETPMTINVGGQFFETTVQVLTADPYSLMAAICRVKPVFEPSPDGSFYFDRDWWLFRHILVFLRSRKLPNELETLKELYKEASYYRMESLQRAIEAIPMDQVVSYSPHIAVSIPGLPK